MLPEDPDTAAFRRLTLRDDRRVTVRAIFPEDKTIQYNVAVMFGKIWREACAL